MSPIETIQPDLVAKLNSEPFFSDINVFAIREERVESEIKQALAGTQPKAGKIGAVVEVMMPMIRTPNKNAPGPIAELSQIIRVKENPTLNLGKNGTKKTAEAIALQILQLFHGFYLQGLLQSLYPAPDAMEHNRDFWPMVTYDVKLGALFPLAPLAKLPMPGISSPAQTVTLTGQGTIYYTTDGTFPGPGNSAAHRFSAPFTVPSGTVVRTAVYDPAFAGSDILMATIN
jgi:hypothetical protein